MESIRHESVMVRAYRNEPVKLAAVGAAPGAVLVAGGDPGKAIGFPVGAVFRLDLDLFGRLRAAFDAGDQARLEEFWRAAEPFSSAVLAEDVEQQRDGD